MPSKDKVKICLFLDPKDARELRMQAAYYGKGVSALIISWMARRKKEGGRMSQRGNDWKEFAEQVHNHIEEYTVPQYGDKDEDQATSYTIEDHIKQAQKYLARFGRSSRPGQEMLDFRKAAHYIQMAATTFKEEARNAAR